MGTALKESQQKKSEYLDDPLLPQPFARLQIDSKLIENLVVVRTKSGSGAANPGRGARKFRRRSGYRRDRSVGLCDLLHHVAREHMRIARGLGVRTHGGACDRVSSTIGNSFGNGLVRAPSSE